MNLLFITCDFPPFDGGKVGHSIRSYSLVNYLSSSFETVYVLLVGNRLIAASTAPEMQPNVVILNTTIASLPKPSSDLKEVFEWSIRFVSDSNITHIISSSPPLSAHLLACNLKSVRPECFWVADTRDLTSVHAGLRGKTPQDQRNIEKVELQLLAGADHVVVVSKYMATYVRDKLKAQQGVDKQISVIENGFVEHDSLPEAQATVRDFCQGANANNKLVLYYAGTGSISKENSGLPRYKELWPFLGVFQEFPDLAQKFAIIVQGAVNIDINLIDSLDSQLSILTLRPANNAQVVANMRCAQIGLSLNLDEVATPFIMGGKLYDYLYAQLFILLVYPTKPISIMACLERTYARYRLADPSSIKSIAGALFHLYEELHAKRTEPLEMRGKLAEFTRYSQYAKYKAILN